MKKKDQAYKGSRLEEIVLRYESALQEGRSEYFDVDDIEALIDYYMEDEQVATAQTITEFGLSLHPNNTNLKIAQAKIDLFIGHVKESEEIAAFLQTLEPDNLDIKVLVGQLLLFRGKKEEAKALFNGIMKNADICGKWLSGALGSGHLDSQYTNILMSEYMRVTQVMESVEEIMQNAGLAVDDAYKGISQQHMNALNMHYVQMQERQKAVD